MSAFLAKLVTTIAIEVVERILKPLAQKVMLAIERQRKAAEDRKKTAEVLEGVKNAETEAERIEAARRSARNGS